MNNENWKIHAIEKGVVLSSVTESIRQSYLSLSEKVNSAFERVAELKRELEQHKLSANIRSPQPTYVTQIDRVARAESDLEKAIVRLNAFLKQRDALKDRDEERRIGLEAIEISKIFTLEVR